MIKRWIVATLFALSLASCRPTTPRLILATTTSTQDSGLLDQLLPQFEQKYRVDVDVIAVGTGEALALGKAGDADVVLVHARAKEEAFVAEGHGITRYDVMCNDFLLVGPADDPVAVRGLPIVEALANIAQAQFLFLSRGDESGTHTREQQLWEKAGIVPTGAWYQRVGQGMGATLSMTQEQLGYTLSDRATFAKQSAHLPDLAILVEGDVGLLNPYSVIAVNPDLHPRVNHQSAEQFVQWLISPETLIAIEAYEIGGQPAFFTNPANPADCMRE